MVKENENSEFKAVKLNLKIDLVPDPTGVKWIVRVKNKISAKLWPC